MTKTKTGFKVLILGGGLAGAAAAKELADNGIPSLLVEISDRIGGKARAYGCKATDKCAGCGVCLTGNLWDAVSGNPLIDVRLDTKLVDLFGEKGAYTAVLTSGGTFVSVDDISEVIVATGSGNAADGGFGAFVEIEKGSASDGPAAVITGSDLESMIRARDQSRIFEETPNSVAFIQCYGSRDVKNGAMYCSRVCCGYSTRAARLIKQYYPECRITFFCMEMQQVGSGNYVEELEALGVDIIKCRPIKATAGKPASVTFDNPKTGRRETRPFDLLVLADGIRPVEDADRIAELCGLGQTEAGFLQYVGGLKSAAQRGVYIAGCAGGPMKIEETYDEAVAVARQILSGGEKR